MKITKIEAKNFRTLENFNLSISPNYCAISGRNNAGKSAIVSIIEYFFGGNDDYRYFAFANDINFSKDATKWSQSDEMAVSVEVSIDITSDSEIYFVISKLSEINPEESFINVKLELTCKKTGQSTVVCYVNEKNVGHQVSSEILKKFKSSNSLTVHNSTMPSPRMYYGGESYTEVLETNFSEEDRSKIAEAQVRLQNSVKRAAKQHKEELDKLLGKLSDKYQVELSSIAGGRSSKFPLEVKLTDKRVDVPLKDWGAGTQNRTRILLSVLESIRSRKSASAENRTTPIFIVEEPESFLHPSAQAEFGQVLNGLAKELQIQIIATTHSPYMLNQSEPEANYLLERRISRGIPKEATVKDTSGEEWMLPFAENLGIVPKEFSSWKELFGTQSSKVILVEGDIDKQYFEQFRDKYQSIYNIPSDVEIVSYGGKDALKNTPILQFMINKFGKVYVTFDLDAEKEVRPSLERIGLKADSDFCSIGIKADGSECIEGLLPVELKQEVYAKHYDLVTAITSQNSDARRSAKSNLKAKFLEAFKKNHYDDKYLKEFKMLFAKIAKEF